MKTKIKNTIIVERPKLWITQQELADKIRCLIF
jgi:hypothetical protein